jgi:hypothetical protein
LGGLLGLVYYLYLALLVLGDDGGVVGADQVLAVELFERPQICLGVVHVVVFARVQEHRVVTHLATLLTCALVVLPAFALACRSVTTLR